MIPFLVTIGVIFVSGASLSWDTRIPGLCYNFHKSLYSTEHVWTRSGQPGGLLPTCGNCGKNLPAHPEEKIEGNIHAFSYHCYPFGLKVCGLLSPTAQTHRAPVVRTGQGLHGHCKVSEI